MSAFLYIVRFQGVLSDSMISVADVGVPTSIDFVRSEPNHMVAAYNSKAVYIFDLETVKPIVNFEYASDAG